MKFRNQFPLVTVTVDNGRFSVYLMYFLAFSSGYICSSSQLLCIQLQRVDNWFFMVRCNVLAGCRFSDSNTNCKEKSEQHILLSFSCMSHRRYKVMLTALGYPLVTFCSLLCINLFESVSWK